MNYKASVAIALGVAMAVAGCQRFSGNRNYAAPLPATPTTPVGEGELQPLDPLATPEGQALDPNGAPNTTITMAEPSGALDIDRSDMAGGWKISSGADNCMAFMALTAWSGGYRANTRGCNSPLLSSIAAWDLTGKQVLLKNANGGAVASVYASGPQQFSGQTATGEPISLFR